MECAERAKTGWLSLIVESRNFEQRYTNRARTTTQFKDNKLHTMNIFWHFKH